MDTKDRNTGPEISVIVPVLNEPGINILLDHINRISSGHSIEIIVSDGDPNGSTVALVKEPSVRKLISPKGRAAQMNMGASTAGGQMLVFLHADTLLPDNAFNLIAEVAANRKYAAGAFDLGFSSKKFIFILIAVVGSIKHRLTRVPFGDQAIFMRSEYFKKLGGFGDIPLMEDIDLVKRIKRAGLKIKILPCRVKTSHRKWQNDGVLYTIFRNWACQIMYLFGIPAHRLYGYYYKDATGGSR